MGIEETADPVTSMPEQNAPVPNTVALIGIILVAIAGVLCLLLLILVNQLPDEVEKMRELKGTGPAQLQLLILLCSTAVLTIVAFFLCAVGLFLPNRPRLLAITGTTLSLLLLFGVFGVVIAGTLMQPTPGGPG